MIPFAVLLLLPPRLASAAAWGSMLRGQGDCAELCNRQRGLRLHGSDRGDGLQAIWQGCMLLFSSFPRPAVLGLGNTGSMRHGGNKVVRRVVCFILSYESLH